MLNKEEQRTRLIRLLVSENAEQRAAALAEIRAYGWLTDGSLEACELVAVQLDGGLLIGACLSRAVLDGANFDAADLTDADLQEASLAGASLRSATLAGARLQKADLSDADLTGADLRGANLEGVRWEGAVLAGAQIDETTTLPDGAFGAPEGVLTAAPGNGRQQAGPKEGARREQGDDGEAHATKSTRRQIRGSTLLLAGRFISMAVNFLVQVLTVNYLSKEAYGAFAYVLSLVGLGETIVTLGLDRAVTRFVPIYEEQDDYPKLFGTLVMVYGSMISIGLLLIVGVVALQQFIATELINDQLTVDLLVILVALAPLQALDNVLNGTFAVFSRPRAIFFRKYVLAPGLKLAVVILLVLGSADVTFLAFGYLAAAAIGVLIFVVLLWRVFVDQGLLQRFRHTALQFPVREVLAFTIPLLASDLVYVVMNTVDAVLLERTGGTVNVAAFRAVQPTAKLNQLVLMSFALLFTPAAARMFARKDKKGINDLYWQNAAWVAIASFPIFAATFSLAEPVTVLLYGERYEGSAAIMAMLALGYYFNAATGQNGLTLKVLGKLRYIVSVDILAAFINLGLNLLLIPRYGAMGAAVGTMTTLILFNILKQVGLMLGTNIRVFDFSYAKVYLWIVLSSLALLLFQLAAEPPFIVGFAAVVLVSMLVVRFNRSVLNLETMFPELLRIPIVRWLLGS